MTEKTINESMAEINAEAMVRELQGGLSPQAAPQAADSKTMRVLVVDDDRIIRTLISRGLQASGLEVVTAENGAVAMKAVRESEPHAIVVDLMMPVVGGLSFLRWLRTEAELETPVIVSSSTSSENRQKAKEAGATKVLPKTSDLSEFVMHVHNVLK